MSRERLAYYLNMDVTNRLRNGNCIILKSSISEITNLWMQNILTVLNGLSYSSVYIVGCGLGDILLNLKTLKPTTLVDGCEVSGIFHAFAQRHFGNVTFETGEPPYSTIPASDVVVSIDYLDGNYEWKSVVKQMVKAGKTVVIFDSIQTRAAIKEAFPALNITESPQELIITSGQVSPVTQSPPVPLNTESLDVHPS